MTNTELAIMGLLAENPKHAYRLEQEIAERGMRDWTEIGFSSIYHVLNKLENAGWLTSALSGMSSGPARRVYHLTHQGRQAIHDGVETRLANPRPRSSDFLLGLANLPALSKEEVCQAISTCRSILRQRLAVVREKQLRDQAASKAGGQDLPTHVNALFDYTAKLMAAEFDWIDAYLAQENCHGETGDQSGDWLD